MAKFLGGENVIRSSTKKAEKVNFKFCTHISYRVLHKTAFAFNLIMS